MRDWLTRKGLHYASRRPPLWWAVMKLRKRYGKPVILDAVLHRCPCGCELFEVLCTFAEYEMTSYSTTMWCAQCGTQMGAPTPLDDPDCDVDYS